MSRPLVEVEIEGKKLNAVLDTGSRRSYIRSEFVERFPTVSVHPFEVKLGGEILSLKEGRVISGIVKDSLGRAYRFGEVLFPIKDLGEEKGKRIDILFGAVILEDWGTVIDEGVTPPQVDYRILRKGELVELCLSWPGIVTLRPDSEHALHRLFGRKKGCAMGRVRTHVVVAGRHYWTLFDGGARNTYIVQDLTSLLPTFDLEKPEPVSLGGRVHEVTKECRLTCLVEGLPVRTHARVLEEIGTDEEGERVEILIGALAMQEWGIRPIPDEERLDMSHYPKEFIEFMVKGEDSGASSQ